jgi:hypothetical protein
MKTLFPLTLIVALAVACTSIPSEVASSAESSLTPFPSPVLPPKCGTTKLGKPGTQTREDSHSVLVEGIAILCNQGSLFEESPTVLPLQEAMIDLDSGIATVEAADLGFSVGGTMRFYGITPINNAVGTLWSLSGITNELPPQPTFEQCKEQVNLFNNDNVPLYVCVITSEGHIARVKFEKSDPVQQVPSVEISFITWEERIEKP